MGGAEVVLVPEVFDIGGIEAGVQALERLVVHTGYVNRSAFSGVVGVLGAEFDQALLGTWRDAIEVPARSNEMLLNSSLCRLTPSKLEGSARLPMTSTIGVLKFWRPAVRVVLETRELDVGQAQFAPLADSVAVVVGQGAVGAASDVFRSRSSAMAL